LKGKGEKRKRGAKPLSNTCSLKGDEDKREIKRAYIP